MSFLIVFVAQSQLDNDSVFDLISDNKVNEQKFIQLSWAKKARIFSKFCK